MKNTLIISLLFGVSLLSCQKDPQEKLCEGIICDNDGECVNGACNCPPEWTGPSCAQEVAPIKMRVTKISLTDFPLTDAGGAGWDLFDGADVFLAIYKNGALLHETAVAEDLTTQQEWTVNFEFSDPTATYNISVLDYDDGITADDFMGGINFTPYKPGQKFPTSYTLMCSGCAVAFDFTGIIYFH